MAAKRLYSTGVGINLQHNFDNFRCMVDTWDVELLVKRATALYALHRLHCGIRSGAFVPDVYDAAFARFVRSARDT